VRATPEARRSADRAIDHGPTSRRCEQAIPVSIDSADGLRVPCLDLCATEDIRFKGPLSVTNSLARQVLEAPNAFLWSTVVDCAQADFSRLSPHRCPRRRAASQDQITG